MTHAHRIQIKKLITLNPLLALAANLRESGKKIVWTSGCFDILHAGHIHYLEEAREFGDILVVGLNSDNSVRTLKGNKRPLFTQLNRALVLNAIQYIDYIIIYDEPTSCEILKRLKPEIYVKGGDYSIHSIDAMEKEIVERNGGHCVILENWDGLSTTHIINRIRTM